MKYTNHFEQMYNDSYVDPHLDDPVSETYKDENHPGPFVNQFHRQELARSSHPREGTEEKEWW